MSSSSSNQGLQSLGNGLYAYLQRDGSWGWNNAGLIVDGDQSLLVDTLFDLPQTEKMLRAMRSATRAADHISVVINTHANGDHCWGNQLVRDADIIASKRAAEELLKFTPDTLAKLMTTARWILASGAPGRGILRLLARLGFRDLGILEEIAPFAVEVFGEFDFSGIELTPPNKTFEKELDLRVGDKAVQLIEVGPAHTQGDVLVYVPEDKTLFTGDILFIGGHPILWAGPIRNWIAACNRILALDVAVVVPGHGPLTDKKGVKAVRDYLAYVEKEARQRYDAGMSAYEAALDISLKDFSDWGESERIVANVNTLYREFAETKNEPNIMAQFADMARVWKQQRNNN